MSGRLDGGSLHESTVAANETVIGTSSASDMHLLVVDADGVDVLSSGDGDVTNVDIGDEVVAVRKLVVIIELEGTEIIFSNEV